MPAHYLLAAQLNLQQLTDEHEPQTCSILWASFCEVA